MVHSESSEGKKRKPRGRPFTSEYNPRKPKNRVLDAKGHKSGDGGGIIAPEVKSSIVDPLKEELGHKEKIESKTFDDTQVKCAGKVYIEKEYNGESEEEFANQEGESPEEGVKLPQNVASISLEGSSKESTKTPDGTVIDQIEFRNGENVIKIVYKKQHNRSFRIQTFLNEETEIRPVTYTGSSTANTFWNLLKGSLKK